MGLREIHITDAVETLLVEQMLAMVRELRSVCQTAPDGHVLAQAEKIAVERGRELTRKTLENVLNEQAKEVEKKGRRRGNVLAAEIARIVGDGHDPFSQRPVC
jgi:hypothetical protein